MTWSPALTPSLTSHRRTEIAGHRDLMEMRDSVLDDRHAQPIRVEHDGLGWNDQGWDPPGDVQFECNRSRGRTNQKQRRWHGETYG
jgi:hypothetical protein